MLGCARVGPLLWLLGAKLEICKCVSRHAQQEPFVLVLRQAPCYKEEAGVERAERCTSDCGTPARCSTSRLSTRRSSD